MSLQPHPPERPSRVRNRPVSFGNPALGTYKGNVYTVDDSDLMASRPFLEGVQTTERMVAMVDVPPEQVPEGILNLSRSHRPFIDHVRIVIAEREPIDVPSKAEGDTNRPRIPSISAMEDAASILAQELDGERQSTPKQTLQQQTGLHWPDEEEELNRTYVVLFHLINEQDAVNMVEDLNGKPFTSLDETVTCSIYHVIALNGEGGVSLLNPMFAPCTKKTHGALEILPSDSNTEDESADVHGSTESNTGNAGSANNHLGEDPNCAVCLEHMSWDPNSEDKTSILTTVCNHTFHLDCLVQCQDSPCPVCRYDHSGLNEALSQCHLCGTTEHNYVCLICGVVSCVSGYAAAAVAPDMARSTLSGGADDSCGRHGGAHHSGLGAGDDNSALQETAAIRFQGSHAGQHYRETLHAYALDTETQHVWDFAGQGYVHRLLSNKDDGKLVEVADPNNTTSQERTLTPGLSDAQEGEVVHRKLEGFASQYYTLLKSQLEQQRTFYEGRLEEIRRDFATKESNATSEKADFLSVLRQEKKQLTHRLVSLKRKKEKATEDVSFLRNMNESLEANKLPIERRIKEAQREQTESREMIQKYLPALEEKVTTLMLQLEESLTATAASTGS